MNIDHLIAKVRATVDSHKLEEGVYCRWLWQNKEGGRKLGINEYGCADAANLLYTIGDFERDPTKRACWVRALQEMQNPETGLFEEGTHHPFHTTAHCVAALELFDAMPRYPLTAMLPYLNVEALYGFLEGLDWSGRPWSQSHQGAGLYSALTITRACGLDWQKEYFGWLRDNCDPQMGMSYKGGFGKDMLSHHMYGWFHYFFNHEYARRPIPYPERLIDTCIDMYVNGKMDAVYGREVGFMEIDWIFCMNRASHQTAHRFNEVKSLLLGFAKDFIGYLDSLNTQTDDAFNDLHMLFGAVCALAELQLALPGQVETTVPLKLVLDRRPFI